METLKRYRYHLLIILAAAVISTAVLLTPSIRFIRGRQVLERGVKYPAAEFIAKANGEVTPEAACLPTDEIGHYSFAYTVRNWQFERRVVLNYEVKDTVPPQIAIREKTVIIDPDQEYTKEDILANFSIDEGTFVYYTDYDPVFAGVYSVNIEAADDYGNDSAASFNIIVRDTEAPVVFASGSGTTILKDSGFDIQDHIAYGDDSDGAVVLKVEGEVDTAKVGDYPLHLVLEDVSGNKTEWDITVKVVAKLPEPKPVKPTEYAFEKFLKDHKGEKRLFGIDVSTWQGEIDYEAVKKAGCDFVIMRIGFSFQGQFSVDNQFERNIEKAKEAGLMTGIYLFSYDCTPEEVLSSLDQMFRYLGDRTVDLPIVFDWEDFMDFQDYNMSFRDLNHLYDLFEEAVRAKGYEAILYGSSYYLDTVWKRTADKKIWLAQYSSQPSFADPFMIWQLADNGKIKGIDGPVDLDILYLD